MNMTGRTFVWRAQVEVGERASIRVMVDLERRCDRIADADDRVSPRHAVATGGVAHSERAVDLPRPQLRSCRVDLGLDGRDGVGVDLSTDRRVDELTDRLGEGLVDGAHPFDLC